MRNVKLFPCTLLLLLFTITLFSQSENRDLEAWSSIGIVYKANKKWSFELEEQLRLKENVSIIDGYFTEVTTTYQPNKKIGLSLGARYIKNNDTQGNIQGYENHFRFHMDAFYKHKLKDFSLKYRLRYQNKNELGVSTADGDYPKQNIRFKTSFGYNIKNWKLDPEFSTEIFHLFEKNNTNGFNKYRINLGTSYKVKKIGKFGLYYQLEKEIMGNSPMSTDIIRFKYVYTFKN